MIPYIGCDRARTLLPAWLDKELAVEEQVALDSHLGWCKTCSAHLADLRFIGDAIRMGTSDEDREDSDELSRIGDTVVTRVRVEQEQSLGRRILELFSTKHVVWAALGAGVAALTVLILAGALLYAGGGRTDSLAGVIEMLASPGSDRNPVRLDDRILPPRLFLPYLHDDSPELADLPHDDAVFAFAATVTREGRIAGCEWLLSQYPGIDESPRSSRDDHAEVTRLQTVIAQSRFSPALAPEGPVAVNMVWLIARTTVKASDHPLPPEVDGPLHDLRPGEWARRDS